jgi:hypothetical protein
MFLQYQEHERVLLLTGCDHKLLDPPCWQQYASVGPDDTLYVCLHADFETAGWGSQSVLRSPAQWAPVSSPLPEAPNFCLIALLASVG